MSDEKPAETPPKVEEAVEEKKGENDGLSAAEKLMEAQIDQLVKLFEDEEVPLSQKLSACVKIPTELNHCLMNKERANRLFSSVPLSLFETVFDPNCKDHVFIRPILLHILSFVGHCTDRSVYMRFKPLLPNVVYSAHPKQLHLVVKNTYHNDVALTVCMWIDTPGEGKYLYDTLRYLSSFFVSQKRDLDILQFLVSMRVCINKIWDVATFEPVTASMFDNKVWPYAILSIIRDLLRHPQEKINPEMRAFMWEIISAMTKLVGITWFNSDKNFSKLVVQMNAVEIQMALSDPEKIDATSFQKHLRVLELYTAAICDEELFEEPGMEIIPHSVGDSTRFIISFWVECFLQKIPLAMDVDLAIYNYASYLFVHEELSLQEAKIRKNLGLVFIDCTLRILEKQESLDGRAEATHMFSDLFDRLNEFEILEDRVPIIFMMYMDKLRNTLTLPEWKIRVNDCKCAIMDLRGRVDWYSKATLASARKMTATFTGPQRKEIQTQIFQIFDELPNVN